MRTIQCSIDVDFPPLEMFAILTDNPCDSRWMFGVTGTERLTPGEMHKGSEMICKFGVGPITTMKAKAVIDEFEPGRRFVRRRVGGAMIMKGELMVEPDGNGSTVSWTMDVGINAPVVGVVLDPLLAAWMKVSMRSSLNKLKALTESGQLAATREAENVAYNS